MERIQSIEAPGAIALGRVVSDAETSGRIADATSARAAQSRALARTPTRRSIAARAGPPLEVVSPCPTTLVAPCISRTRSLARKPWGPSSDAKRAPHARDNARPIKPSGLLKNQRATAAAFRSRASSRELGISPADFRRANRRCRMQLAAASTRGRDRAWRRARARGELCGVDDAVDHRKPVRRP